MGMSTFKGSSGYNKTLLKQMSTTIYEPRDGAFTNYNRKESAQSRE